MCGIIGYIGIDNSTTFVIEGLTLLQNRGYDSVGISSIIENEKKLKTIKYASTNTYNSIELLKENIEEEKNLRKPESEKGMGKSLDLMNKLSDFLGR